EETLPAPTHSDAFAHGRSLAEVQEADMNAEVEQKLSADADTLTPLLQQEARSRRKEEWATFAWGGSFIAAILWLVNDIVDAPSFVTNTILCFILMGALGVGMCAQIGRRSYRRKRSFTPALAQAHDVKQVSPLIRTLRVQNTPVRNLAKQA